jgi:hypothetical protein
MGSSASAEERELIRTDAQSDEYHRERRLRHRSMSRRSRRARHTATSIPWVTAFRPAIGTDGTGWGVSSVTDTTPSE